jgi:hypothetical protein
MLLTSSSPNTDLFLFLIGSTYVLPAAATLAWVVGDGARVVGVNLVRAMMAKRLTESHGKSASGQAERKYLLHLGLVVNRLVQVLGVLGVFLR